MKYKQVLVYTIAAVTLFSLSAFAKSKNEGNITVDEPLQVGATQLSPGHYKVEWNGTGNQVKLNIMDHDKTVATVPAKLVPRAEPSRYDALVTTTPTKGQAAQLKEIDFNKHTQALMLEPEGMAAK